MIGGINFSPMAPTLAPYHQTIRFYSFFIVELWYNTSIAIEEEQDMPNYQVRLDGVREVYTWVAVEADDEEAAAEMALLINRTYGDEIYWVEDAQEGVVKVRVSDVEFDPYGEETNA